MNSSPSFECNCSSLLSVPTYISWYNSNHFLVIIFVILDLNSLATSATIVWHTQVPDAGCCLCLNFFKRIFHESWSSSSSSFNLYHFFWSVFVFSFKTKKNNPKKEVDSVRWVRYPATVDWWFEFFILRTSTATRLAE